MPDPRSHRGHQLHPGLPEPGGPAARLRLTWSDFAEAARSLAQQVDASGFRPDLILAIARGGLAPAATLAYALDIRRVAAIDVASYDGDGGHERVPALLGPPPLSATLGGAKVLVVDDVADTGATLEVVKRVCADVAAETRFSVLCAKPRSSVRCEFVWRRTAGWVDFPWSSEQPPPP